ncbi:hypothetical protein ACTMTF_08730 [Nonomuraea sp. ZG12]|uniref:hypothetical protein n=1 Tax=Nonomuraea sp. ZG12 TaxID=3452207 RepID=UPI003F8A7978
MGWDLYFLAPPILILLAARAPRRAPVRRGGPARRPAVVLTVTALLLATVRSAPTGKLSAEHELDCAGFGHGTVTGLTEAEKDFLCEVRGHTVVHDARIREWDGVPDQVVLALGHHLCGLAVRDGGDVGAPAVREAPHASLAGALARLCPAVAREQEAEGLRRQSATRVRPVRSPSSTPTGTRCPDSRPPALVPTGFGSTCAAASSSTRFPIRRTEPYSC